MSRNQDYKNRALASLEGKWSPAVIVTFIYLLITEVISWVVTTIMGADEATTGIIEFAWLLLCLPLGWGMTIYFLNLVRNADLSYGRLFDGYKDFVRVFLTGFLVVVAVLAGFIFFFVPGVILGLMFSQAEYILKDDKEIGPVDALSKSARMMQGHKAELFWLMLSFTGWLILSILTLGLGFLLLQPYFETTMAHYYEDLKRE